VQPAGKGKKRSAGMKFSIDPTVSAFLVPILAAVLSAAVKPVAESIMARKNKAETEKDIIKTLQKNKEIGPELAGKLTTAFVQFIQEHPDLLAEKK